MSNLNEDKQIQTIPDIVEHLDMALLKKDNEFLKQALNDIINIITKTSFDFKDNKESAEVISELSSKIKNR